MARDRTQALVAFALSRGIVWAAGLVAIAVFGLHDNAARFDPGSIARGPGAYWDSVWFLSIARDGYVRPQDAAFFPLYPSLVGALGGSVVAGVAISVVSLVGGLWLLGRLVALDFGDDIARLCVLLVALFPGAVFLSAVYSEALFLLLSVAAVYGARTGVWWLAGLTGLLAASTRSAGIVLLVPLAILWWRGGRPRAGLGALAAVPLGLAAFCAFLELDRGDGLAPFRAQESWGRELGLAVWDGARAAWEGAGGLLGGDEPTWPVYDPRWLDVSLFCVLVLVVVAAVGAVRRLPPAYSLYAVAALALPLAYPAVGQPLMSLPRFVAVLWPLHLWLAVVLVAAGRRARLLVLGAFGIGLALVSGEVSTWGWVA